VSVLVFSSTKSELTPIFLPGPAPGPLEQLFLERINDYRATLSGARTQPFAFDPTLNTLAARHGQLGLTSSSIKAALRRAGASWDARKSFTLDGSMANTPALFAGSRDDRTRAVEQFVVDSRQDYPRAHLPLAGLPGNNLYLSHRIVGINFVLRQVMPPDVDPRFYVWEYTTLTTAYRDNRPLLTGVVYQDTNHNGKYDLDEGLPGVRVSVGPSMATTTVWDTGGFILPVSVRRAATVTVTVSGDRCRDL
jgi:hypothetical protein